MEHVQFLFSRSIFLMKDRKSQDYTVLKGKANMDEKQSSKKTPQELTNKLTEDKFPTTDAVLGALQSFSLVWKRVSAAVAR